MQKTKRISLEDVVQQVEDDEFEYFFDGSDGQLKRKINVSSPSDYQ